MLKGGKRWMEFERRCDIWCFRLNHEYNQLYRAISNCINEYNCTSVYSFCIKFINKQNCIKYICSLCNQCTINIFEYFTINYLLSLLYVYIMYCILLHHMIDTEIVYFSHPDNIESLSTKSKRKKRYLYHRSLDLYQ